MDKKIFGVTGEIGSGKDTIANFMIKEFAAKMFKFSDVLKDICARLNLEINTRNLQGVSTALRSFVGENVLVNAILNDCLKSEAEIIVVAGIRRLVDFENLNKIEGFKLIYVDATIENRYARTLNRDEKVDDSSRSFEDFKKDNKQECEVEIAQLKSLADYVIDNNGSYEEFIENIKKIV